jgi:hypothetical protein
VVHICNLSTWEVETGGLRIQGQPVIHNKFQVSLGYIGKPCLKNFVCCGSGGEMARLSVKMTGDS